MPNNQDNPAHGKSHSSAAGAYAQHAKDTTVDPRELEARTLMRSVQKMQDLQERWDKVKPEEMDDVLRNNRQIWMIFVDNALSDSDTNRPDQLRNNITNLGAYVFKRTLDILADPKKEKIDVLIDINREIAAGLMSKPKTEEPPQKTP